MEEKIRALRERMEERIGQISSKENLAADATLSGTMNLTGALKADAGNNINTRARAATRSSRRA